jgi:hypothetical protein
VTSPVVSSRLRGIFENPDFSTRPFSPTEPRYEAAVVVSKGAHTADHTSTHRLPSLPGTKGGAEDKRWRRAQKVAPRTKGFAVNKRWRKAPNLAQSAKGGAGALNDRWRRAQKVAQSTKGGALNDRWRRAQKVAQSTKGGAEHKGWRGAQGVAQSTKDGANVVPSLLWLT